METSEKPEMTEYILRYNPSAEVSYGANGDSVEEILCHILRSRRKSYGISIDEEGEVFLRIPMR